MSDCIFCKIISGEIPSERVYEDEYVVAFHDISPQAPVHMLVVPKEHIVSLAEITPENSKIAANCLEAIAKIAENKGLDRGFRVVINSGPEAGQTVFHLHFDLLAGKALGPGLLGA